MEAIVPRERLLMEQGYSDPVAQARAIQLMVEAGLTTPTKKNIAAHKSNDCQQLLARSLIRLCHRCRSTDGGSREPVPAGDRSECEVCGGSAQNTAMQALVAGFRSRGLTRLVVVGGSPELRAQLQRAWPADLELRLVTAERSHNRQQSFDNLTWADCVLVWGSTELAHRISDLYTKGEIGREKVVEIHRRSIEAMAGEIVQWLEGGRRRVTPARRRS